MKLSRLTAIFLLPVFALLTAGCSAPAPSSSSDLMEGIVPSQEAASETVVSDRSEATEAFADFAVRLFRNRMRAASGKSGETGFREAALCCIHVDGKALLYEREAPGTGNLTPKTAIDTFTEELEWEGIVWEVFSVEEYPDLSHIVLISGTNSSWTFRALEAAENPLVSPLSVLSALAMTANGAKGETLSEMEAVLGLPAGELNASFGSLLNRPDSKDGDPRFHLANSIWFTDDERFTVNRDFLQTNADCYNAGIYRAPFDDRTLKDINNWVKDNTDGMIPEILDRIPADAVMFLVNALAFDGEWAEVYRAHQVKSGTFTREDGTKQTVDFMRSGEYLYLEDGDAATGFIKPYKGGKYAFAALLPKEGTTIADYAASLDGEKLCRILSSAEQTLVEAALPKFEAEYGAELSETLKAMGMPTAFNPSKADFSGLGTSTEGNIFIGSVLHKTFISVHEQGTKAGAATVVAMTEEEAAAPGPEPKRVTLDRPFIYMLIDRETNLPFFIGALTNMEAICEGLPLFAEATNDTIVVSSSADKPDAHLVRPAVYKIMGNNYFKLRDVALMLNGSGKQFAVDYDDAAKTVSITTGRPYAPIGGELTGAATETASASPTDNGIFIDGETVTLTAFKIGGANYFKLRDLGKALDFHVGYDDETKTVFISGRGGYEEETGA